MEILKYIHEDKVTGSVSNEEIKLREKLKVGDKIQVWKRCRNKVMYGKFVNATITLDNNGQIIHNPAQNDCIFFKLEDGRERCMLIHSLKIKINL